MVASRYFSSSPKAAHAVTFICGAEVVSDPATLRHFNAAMQVASVSQKIVTRNPQPPFITSTLQQDASSKLGFSPSDTMCLAQQLYEGPEESRNASCLSSTQSILVPLMHHYSAVLYSTNLHMGLLVFICSRCDCLMCRGGLDLLHENGWPASVR